MVIVSLYCEPEMDTSYPSGAITESISIIPNPKLDNSISKYEAESTVTNAKSKLFSPMLKI